MICFLPPSKICMNFVLFRYNDKFSLKLMRYLFYISLSLYIYPGAWSLQPILSSGVSLFYASHLVMMLQVCLTCLHLAPSILCAALSHGHFCTVCNVGPVWCSRPRFLSIWCSRPVIFVAMIHASALPMKLTFSSH